MYTCIYICIDIYTVYMHRYISMYVYVHTVFMYTHTHTHMNCALRNKESNLHFLVSEGY